MHTYFFPATLSPYQCITLHYDSPYTFCCCIHTQYVKPQIIFTSLKPNECIRIRRRGRRSRKKALYTLNHIHIYMVNQTHKQLHYIFSSLSLSPCPPQLEDAFFLLACAKVFGVFFASKSSSLEWNFVSLHDFGFSPHFTRCTTWFDFSLSLAHSFVILMRSIDSTGSDQVAINGILYNGSHISRFLFAIVVVVVVVVQLPISYHIRSITLPFH